MHEKYTVLIVEDERSNALLYQSILHGALQCGFSFMFHVECVNRLSLAVARLSAANGVDVVILDLGLSDAVGFEALDKIMAVSDAPIIVITGSIDPTNAARALERGAQAFYLKPLLSTPEQFIHGVWSAIHRQKYVKVMKALPAVAPKHVEEMEPKPPLSKVTIAGIITASAAGLAALIAQLAELVKSLRSK